MKNIIKLLIFLGCCARYANAWHTPTECSLSRYTGSVRCVKLVYNEVNERLDKVYGDILRSLSKDDAAKFAKNYKDWTEERNGACREHSQDEIKFKSCRIDFTIPKLNELWEIESVSAKHPFEGKWADCFYRDGALVCGTYFTVEQGDNVCNADWYRANKDDYYIAIALYKRQNGHIKPVKFCDENGADSYEYTGCDIYEDGYDSQGRKTYRTDVPFADWEMDDDKSTKWGQSFRQTPSFSTTLKTPFLPNEREELIQTNKWLQDCLNYKGE